MAPTTHRVRQRPPLRALVLAASLMVVGSVLMLMADLLDWPPLLTGFGLVVLVAGLAVYAAAWWLARTMSVEVVLDDRGYRIQGPRVSEVGTWGEIGRVTRGDGWITIHRKDGSLAQLVVAPGGTADLDALGADFAHRLDADRGYGS